jgi:hypothetical protein
MFYGKANDDKHYSKIANRVMKLAPRFRAIVAECVEESEGQRHHVLQIRVFQKPHAMEYRFWVYPFDGDWHGTWIYQAVALREGDDLVDPYNNGQIGEPGNWGTYGGKRPFMYTNFAATTAAFFFKPYGPLWQ